MLEASLAAVPSGLAGGMLELPGQLIFGEGCIDEVGQQVARFGRRALVITDENVCKTAGFARAIDALVAAAVQVHIYDRSPVEIPPQAVADCAAIVQAAPVSSRVDVIVGIGGGSCLDLAKLTALLATHGGPLDRYYGESQVPGAVLPVVAVPTTAGTGSEVTTVAVLSDPRRPIKVGISDRHLRPRVAICDPLLTMSCPRSTTAFSGVDAITHAVEAYLAPVRPPAWGNPDWGSQIFRGQSAWADPFALQGLALLAGNLDSVLRDGADVGARARMMLGSTFAGIAFGHAGTAAAHALQYPLGVATRTPHGLGVGLLLPYVLSYVRDNAVDRLATIGAVLGVAAPTMAPQPAAEAAVAEISRLIWSAGIPRSLREIGVTRAALPRYAAEAATVTRLLKNSPRVLEQSDLLAILELAWAGQQQSE